MKKVYVLMIFIMFIFSVFAAHQVYAGSTSVSDEKKITKETEDPTVYVKEGGKKYHKKNCKVVPTGKKAIKLSEAVKNGYEPCKVCKPPTLADVKVMVNPNGKKYHKKGCQMVKKDAVEMTIAEAKKKGLEPCKICHPPLKEKK